MNEAMNSPDPIPLTQRRLRRAQHLTHEDATRELDLLSEEMGARAEAGIDAEFDQFARDSLRRPAEIFAKLHTPRGELAARLFEVLEAAVIDKEPWAQRELDEFFGE